MSGFGSKPFLRKGSGMKTKIDYPVLRRSTLKPLDNAVQYTDPNLKINPSNEVPTNSSPFQVNIENITSSSSEIRKTEQNESESPVYKAPSIPRTVRTADSGFPQDLEDVLLPDSTNHADSTHPPTVTSFITDLEPQNNTIGKEMGETDRTFLTESTGHFEKVEREIAELHRNGEQDEFSTTDYDSTNARSSEDGASSISSMNRMEAKRMDKESAKANSIPSDATPSNTPTPLGSSTPHGRPWGSERSTIISETSNKFPSFPPRLNFESSESSHSEERRLIAPNQAPLAENFKSIFETKQVPRSIRPSESTRRFIPSFPPDRVSREIGAEKNVETYPSVTCEGDNRKRKMQYSGDVAQKLAVQLRDAIAHLDYADSQLQRKAKEIMLAVEKFMKDKAAFELDKERFERSKKQLEKEKKLMMKNGTDREKSLKEQLDDAMKTISEKERQLTGMRVKIRKMEERNEKVEKELENYKNKAEKSQKNVESLQRQIASIRGSSAKQMQQMAAEVRAAQTRNGRACQKPAGLLRTVNKQVVSANSTPSDLEPFVTATEFSRAKGVSWADTSIPSKTAIGNHDDMELIELGQAQFGPCRLFKNTIGEWTKVTTTECGCELYEYSNADVRWLSCDRTVEINYYGSNGANTVDLGEGRLIRYFNIGQIEIWRSSGEVSRFDPISEKRTETVLRPDGTFFVEIFQPSGQLIRIDRDERSIHDTAVKSSFRGRPYDRHVINHTYVEAEWVEPEYCLRRFANGSMKLKLRNLTVCFVGNEDLGYVSHTTVVDGQQHKRFCVRWGRSVREGQRRIEAAKVAALTAMNSTAPL